MSYDLMVFNQEAAPKTQADFMVWYKEQTQWAEAHTYDDPSITTPELRAWLMEMVQTFPDMNGDDTTGDPDNDYETGYTIGRDIIYVDFRWSLTEQAYKTAHRLAQKYQVGLFDPSFEGPILLPQNGELKPMVKVSFSNQEEKKPWWRIW